MGIGRREFLKIFGGVLSNLAVQASPAVALLEDLYINRKLGLAFTKPQGWHFADIQQMGLVKQGQLLDLSEPSLAADILASSDLPIATMTKDPLTAKSGSFTPGINVYLEKFSSNDELWADVGNDALVACELDAEACPRFLKRFSVLSNPKVAPVPNCTAGEYTAEFLFEHIGLRESVQVRMRSIVILECPTWYTVRLYDSPYLAGRYEVNYSEFIGTMRVV